MAKLAEESLQFTGTLQGISVYKRIDCKEPIVRTKGGASKEKIDTLPSFAPTRRQNREWDGSSKAASAIRKVLLPLKYCGDHNMIAALKPVVMDIQKMDNNHEHGKRQVHFSQAPRRLSGFSFNKRNPLESILTTPVKYTLSKESLSATLEIPRLLPRLNFFPIGTFPVYKWIGVLGVVPDYIVDENKGYIPAATPPASCIIDSGWLSVKEEMKPLKMDFSLALSLATDSFVVLLALGIRFGLVRFFDKTEAIKYAGAAKVIGVV